MPITPTYPGVYIEEVPSGVRTITGVSTSVTAFIGGAKRGPVNKAVRILGFADFERRFGGLSRGAEMSYGVRQFFNNGGTEAWVVRVAQSAAAGTRTLKKGTTDVLIVTAKDAGSSGNDIRVLVDTATANPLSTFNLTFVYNPPDNPSGAITEKFENLSMNSADARYVESLVNPTSQLATVKRVPNVESTVSTAGISRSGQLVNSDWQTLDATHNQFRISVNGGDPVTITFTPPGAVALNAFATTLNGLVTAAGAAVTAPADRLIFTSSTTGEKSTVRILPGLINDASVKLKLGSANGGEETDAAATIRPDIVPLAGTLDGDTATLPLPVAGKTNFRISVDGGIARSITLAVPGAPYTADQLAKAIQDAVRAADTSSEGYKKLTVAAIAGPKLRFTSGTKGTGSSIVITAGATEDLAAQAGLLSGTTSTPGADVTLQGGNEVDFNPASPFSAVIASRALRTGIFALDSVDLFNMLCIPGVSDGPTLAEAAAYCQERRAFMIVDPPRGLTPDAMESLATSAALPKTSYASISYPWVQIADPLNNGALRSVAPSATLAGVFARTDATRGVWKAPAGTEANLVGVQAADYALSDRENGILNPRGVNCNRVFPVYGAVSWGARTLQGDNAFASEWKYVPVRRLALFLEESLYRGTQWVVFEPNDEPLWAQIRLNVGAFMQNLFRQGAFQGRSPREAYLVKCDKDTTTQNDINLGVVNVLVGFAPLKPAEFVFIRIQQLAGQIQT
ncbi:MAG TPA: phage tail sheath C-terminal domain-containing protein [Thermoanaerobaculia bacterium]|nr:phage tail sheath C-terminal domain-containing protein [Thermoanaerobaculia bacterium]